RRASVAPIMGGRSALPATGRGAGREPRVMSAAAGSIPMSFFPREIREARRAGFTVPDLARLSHWLPIVLVLAAALLLRRYVVPNVDVSWCLTLAEKILDGQRLYVDVLELNPPGGLLLYLPPVMVARLLGLQPESVTDIFVIAAACT